MLILPNDSKFCVSSSNTSFSWFDNDRGIVILVFILQVLFNVALSSKRLDTFTLSVKANVSHSWFFTVAISFLLISFDIFRFIQQATCRINNRVVWHFFSHLFFYLLSTYVMQHSAIIKSISHALTIPVF